MFFLHLPSTLLEEPVTYSCRAKAIPSVLADLTKSTGVALTARDEAKEEIVYLHVEGLPLDSLMHKIAFVTSCEWDKKGNGFVLRPAAAVRAHEEIEEKAEKAAKIREEIRKQIEKLEGGDQKLAEEELVVWGTSDETEVAVLRLAAEIDPAELASFAEDGSEVWVTNNPKDGQLLLPSESRDVIAEYIDHLNRVIQADLEALKQKLAAPDLSTEDREVLQKELADKRELASMPAKTLLRVQAGPGDVLRFDLRSYNAEGPATIESSASINTRDYPEDKKTESVGQTLVPVQLSPDSRLICEELGDETANPSVSEGRLAKFVDLERFDPLSYIPTDMIEAFRKNGHPQIVACVPDRMLFSALRLSRIGPVDAQKFTRRSIDLIRGSGFLKASYEDSVTLLKPIHPVVNRNERVNRADYGSLLKDCLDHGCPTLAELGSYALNHPDFEMTSLDNYYEMLFSFSLMAGGGRDSWPGLRFLGSLSSDQQTTLRTSGAIDLATPTSVQETCAYQLVFWSQTRFSSMEPLLTGHTIGLPESLQSEPSEMLPNGLNRGQLIGVAVTQPAMMAYLNRSNLMAAAEDVADFEGLSDASMIPKKVRMGEFTKLELIFPVSRGVGAHVFLRDASVPSGAPLISFDQVPTDFVAKVNAIVKQRQSDRKSNDPEQAVP